LNETAFGEGLVVRGTHYLFGGKVKNMDTFVLKEKELALKLALHPWILGASVNLTNIENISAVLKNFVRIIFNFYLGIKDTVLFVIVYLFLRIFYLRFFA